MKKKITIAIDGYAACGKSTLAKDLAKALGYTFIDTGAMYRAVAFYCLEQNLITETGIFNTEQITAALPQIAIELSSDQKVWLNETDVTEEIRTPKVAGIVSKIASIKSVRIKLVEQQQAMGNQGGIVMDGRDIASVVFPNAELKLFVWASDEIRTQRRMAELRVKGENINEAEVLANLKSRDLQDSTREESPLIQVPEAIILDTSVHTRESQLKWALEIANQLIEEKI
jgi:cytidylate kinase